MTKEAKIGLLIGLSFVIVLGILLTDFMSGTAQPPQAPLSLAGTSARSALGDSPLVVKVPSTIEPRGVVPIKGDLNKRQSAPSRRVDPKPVDADKSKPVEVPQRTYAVQAGDSLQSIAQRAYGSGSKANRDRIIAANPSLVANPSRLIVGKTYVIPAGVYAAVESAANESPRPESPRPESTASTDEVFYVVKPNDSLFSIAKSQVGTSSAVGVIRELNKLTDDRLRVNMKLRLPRRVAGR